jgi:hypothetical protein
VDESGEAIGDCHDIAERETFFSETLMRLSSTLDSNGLSVDVRICKINRDFDGYCGKIDGVRS